MDVLIITPTGQELKFVINDWCAINEKKELTEVGLVCVETKHAKMIHHTLEYNSIKVSIGTDYLLILDKPNEFSHNSNTNKLILKYN